MHLSFSGSSYSFHSPFCFITPPSPSASPHLPSCFIHYSIEFGGLCNRKYKAWEICLSSDRTSLYTLQEELELLPLLKLSSYLSYSTFLTQHANSGLRPQ